MKINELKNGDLLFMTDSSDMDSAIKDIEKGSLFSHIGIFFDNKVYHATIKKGVAKEDLLEYLKEEKEEVTVYRYPLIDEQKVKEKAESYIGLPYNHSFYPDGKGFYCSQYVSAILPIFETIPMKFGDNSNEITPYWKKYYKDLGLDVPLGKPGTNPYQLSLSDKIKYIDKLEY